MYTMMRGSRLNIRVQCQERVLYLALVMVLVFSFGANAAVKRVLLVGDSWTQYPFKDGVFSYLLSPYGVEARGDNTALGGTTAIQWAQPASLDLLTYELAAYPTIDIVYLSIGGNDLLALYNTADTPAQQAQDRATIRTAIQTVVNHILMQRANIRVVIVDYDYLNLWDTLLNSQAAQIMWLYLGQPTPAQINGAFVSMGFEKLDLAQNTPRCEYVQNWGLMQHTYGYGSIPGSAFPFPGYAATGYVPYPGGSSDLPSPTTAMRDLGGGERDAIHLTVAGYVILAENVMNQ